MTAELTECHGCHRPIRQEGVPWRQGDPAHDDHADGCKHYVCNPYRPDDCAIDPDSGTMIHGRLNPTYGRIVTALIRADENNRPKLTDEVGAARVAKLVGPALQRQKERQMIAAAVARSKDAK